MKELTTGQKAKVIKLFSMVNHGHQGLLYMRARWEFEFKCLAII